MALEQREISILLSFTSDPQTRAAIEAAFKSLDGGLKTTEQAVERLNVEFTELAAQIAKVQDPAKRAAGFEGLQSLRQSVTAEIKASKEAGALNMGFVEQRERVRQATDQLRKYNDGLTETTKSAGGMGKAMSMAMLGFGLQMTGRQLQGMSASFFGMASNFAENADAGNKTAERWLAATERINDAQMRIGATLATAVQPYLEQLADLAEKAANFAEEHPEVVKAIAGLAAGTFAAGAAMMAIGLPMNIAATGMQLGGMMGIGGAAAGAAGAGGAGIGAAAVPVIAGLVVSVLAYMGASWIFDKIKQPGQESLTQEAGKSSLMISGIFSVGLGKLTDTLGLTDGAAEQAARGAQKMVNAFDRIGEAAPEAGKAIEQAFDKEKWASAVNAFIDYRKAEADAEREYSERRSEIVRDYAEQRSEIEARYEQQRTQIMQNYARTRARAEQDFRRQQDQAAAEFARAEREAYADYQQQRTEAVSSYNQQIEDLESAHRERLRKMAEDHESRVEELVAARDALGLVAEQRRYRREKAEENRSYQEERRQARQDLRNRLAEMDAEYQAEKSSRAAEFARKQQESQEEFDLQQQRRKEDYQRQLSELEASHRQQQQEAQQHYQQQLTQLSKNYQEEKRRRQQAFNQQLIDLGVHTGKVKQEWDRFYADMETKLRQFIDRANSMGNDAGAGSRAFGGYAGFGLYRLGDAPGGGPGGKEFVMNAATTRQAERFIGGGLTQAGLLGALAGGGSISIGAINLPQTTMSEGQLTRYMRDKFPGLLADALEKAQRGRRI